MPTPAALTLWILDAFAGSTSHIAADDSADGASAPGTSTASTGATVGTTVASRFSNQQAGTKVAAGTFTSTTGPPAAPGTSNCIVSKNTFSGVFAATNWTIASAVIGSTTAPSGTVRLRFRVFASTDQSFQTGARELTTSTVVSSTTSGTLSTTVAQNLTATWACPGAVFNAEYIGIEVTFEVVTASASSTAGFLWRQDATHSKITTSLFTPNNVEFKCEADVGFGGTTANTAALNGQQRAGDLIAVGIIWIRGAITTVTGVTDTSGNTYVQAGSTETVVGGAFGTPGNVAIWYAKNVAAASPGTNTVTVTFSDGNAVGDVSAAVARGCDTTSPLVTTVGNQALVGGTTATTGTYTASVPAGIAFAVFYNDQQGAVGASAPFVNIFLPTDRASSFNYRILPGAVVTEQASATQNSGAFAGFAAVFAAPAAAPFEDAAPAILIPDPPPILLASQGDDFASTSSAPLVVDDAPGLPLVLPGTSPPVTGQTDEPIAAAPAAALDETAASTPAVTLAPATSLQVTGEDAAPPATASPDEAGAAAIAPQDAGAPPLASTLEEPVVSLVSEDGTQAQAPPVDGQAAPLPTGEDAAYALGLDEAAAPAGGVSQESAARPPPVSAEEGVAAAPLGVDESAPGTIAQAYELQPILPPPRPEDLASTSTATLGADEQPNPTQLFPEPQASSVQWPEDLAAPTALDETGGRVPLPVTEPTPSTAASFEEWLSTLPPPPEDASWTILVAADGTARLTSAGEDFAVFVPPPPIVDEVSGLAPPQPVLPPPWYAIIDELPARQVTGSNPSTQRVHAVQLVRATVFVEEDPLFVGDITNIVCEVVDQFGAPADPGVVTANVRTPDGVVTAQTVTRTGPGVYQITGYVWPQQFGYFVRFQGTAPFPFNIYQSFSVQASPF